MNLGVCYKGVLKDALIFAVYISDMGKDKGRIPIDRGFLFFGGYLYII